jgi:small subunit ribosomal protein S5
MIVNNKKESVLIEKLITVKRTAKVVKGGRNFSFSALVVVGDGKGRVGFGLGKSSEVPDAVRKAMDHARKNMYKIELKGKTIQHNSTGYHSATKVILLPATSGTGVIAGGAVRAICEVAGIQDILSKCIGSRCSMNVVRATMDAFHNIYSPIYIKSKRNLFNKEDSKEETQIKEEN